MPLLIHKLRLTIPVDPSAGAQVGQSKSSCRQLQLNKVIAGLVWHQRPSGLLSAAHGDLKNSGDRRALHQMLSLCAAEPLSS